MARRLDIGDWAGQLMAVRLRVFVEEQGVPPEEERDSLDETAVHFGAYLMARGKAAECVGSARLVALDARTGKVGRVAVLPEHRERGVGSLLMRTVEEVAQEEGLLELLLDSQLHAVGFYQRLGYASEGPVFLDAGIQHRRMRKALKHGP